MDNATERTGQGTCTGWQWCGWCQGQPGGCEFCDGSGKRGCPAVVGDTDGRKWQHTTADGQTCTECGSDTTPGVPAFAREGDPSAVAHLECVHPAHGAARV